MVDKVLNIPRLPQFDIQRLVNNPPGPNASREEMVQYIRDLIEYDRRLNVCLVEWFDDWANTTNEIIDTGGTIRVEDEGSTVVATANALNFVGAGVTVTDAGSNEATVTITSGAGDPLEVQEEGTPVDSDVVVMNFTGAGVTATQTSAGEVEIAIPGGSGTTSPLTTKGDIWGYDTDDNRIPVGDDYEVLIADSAETLGVRWGRGSLGSTDAAPGAGFRWSRWHATQIGVSWPSSLLAETITHPNDLAIGNRYDSLPRYIYTVTTASGSSYVSGMVGAQTQAGNANGFVQLGGATSTGGFDIIFVFGFDIMNADSIFHVGLVGNGVGGFGGATNELSARSGVNCFMVGFDCADTSWKLFSNDNVSTPVVTSVPGTWPRPTVQTDIYELRLKAPKQSTYIDWKLQELTTGNNTGWIRATTDLPQNTRLMRPVFHLGNGNSDVASAFALFVQDGVIPW